MKHDQDSTLPKKYCQPIEVPNPDDLEKRQSQAQFKAFSSLLFVTFNSIGKKNLII